MWRGRACRLPLLSLLTFTSFCASSAHASPWTQPKGDGLAIIAADGYVADRYYDNSSNVKHQPRYRKWEPSLYAEYGVTDALTMAARVPYTVVKQSGNWHSGMAQAELSVRARVWKDCAGNVLSLTPIVRLPSPTSQDSLPVIAADTADAGLTAGYGTHFSAWGRAHYVALEGGYMHRFGTPHDQLVATLSSGITVSDSWQLVPAFSTIRRLGSGGRFTRSSLDDYNLSKAGLSTIYAITDTWSVQYGINFDVEGKNTGKGGGSTIALWKKF